MIEYYKELLYFIRKNTSNKDYAQDIVQETYSRVISVENKQKIIDKRAFLYKVARNIIIDKARQSKKQKEISYEENKYIGNVHESEESILEQDRKMILMKELQKLPEKRKEAFVLHVFEGYSRQEVANIMGISVTAVEKHISRASIDLREKMKRKES